MAPQASRINNAPTPFQKAAVSPSSVVYDPVMADMSVLVVQEQDGFVAGEIFPNKNVEIGSAVFPTYDRSYFLRHRVEKTAPDTLPPVVTHGISWDQQYNCQVYKSRVALPKELLARQTPPVDLEQEAVMLLTQHALIFMDEQWIANYFVAGKWATDQTGVAAAPGANQFLQWDDELSTPISDVRTVKRKFRRFTGRELNIGVCSRTVFDRLCDNPQLLARIINNSGSAGNNNPVEVNERTMAAAFGLERIVIAQAIHDVNQQGVTVNPEFIAGDHFGMFHRPKRIGLMTPLPGSTYSWTGYNPGMNNLGFGFRRYFDEPSETWYVEITIAMDMRINANYLGKMMLSAVAADA